jgi:hypothetical protein
LAEFNYSAKTDIHSLACVLFLWDKKKDLLFGRAFPDGDRAHYLQCFASGRPREVADKDGNVYPLRSTNGKVIRECLVDRAQKSILGPMVCWCLSPPSQRPNAREILDSPLFATLKKRLDLPKLPGKEFNLT